MHLPCDGAADRDARDTADALELARQLIRDEVAQLLHVRPVARDGGNQRRDHGGVHLEHIRRGDCVVPARLQVDADGVHVHAVLKLEHHHRDAVLTR